MSPPSLTWIKRRIRRASRDVHARTASRVPPDDPVRRPPLAPSSDLAPPSERGERASKPEVLRSELGRLSSFTPLHGLFFVSLLLAFAVVAQLLVPVATGGVLAYVSERPIDAIERRLGLSGRGLSRWLVATAFVLFVFAVLLVPLGMTIFVAVRDTIDLLQQVRPEQWVEFGDGALELLNAQLSWFGMHLTQADVVQRGRAFLSQNVGWFTSRATSMLTATPQAAFAVLLMTTTWIFFAVDGRRARYALVPRLIPWRFERFVVAQTAEEVIHSVFVSNAAVALVQGIGCFLMMWAFGIPKAFVWGVMAVFAAFVPVVGTAPITVGSALYCWASGRVGAAIVFAIGAVVIGAVDNVLRPLFMRSSVDLDFLWLLIALVGGVALFGFSGLVLGPFVLSLFVASWRALELQDPVNPLDAFPTGEEREQTRASISPPQNNPQHVLPVQRDGRGPNKGG